VTAHCKNPVRIKPGATAAPRALHPPPCRANAAHVEYSDRLPSKPEEEQRAGAALPATATPEVGGRDGPEPTRFGDWELRGRCIDF